MGSFLALISTSEQRAERTRRFHAGVAIFKTVKQRTPSAVVESEWASIAAFPRRNRTGAALAPDRPTGSWLLALGTWFHGDGLRSGDEARLLQACLQSGADSLARDLEGFFTLVFGDGRAEEIVVLTDLVGSDHAFERAWEHGVALSSSSLALAGLARAELDPVGCQEFLRTGTIYEDRTFYREVRKLRPATIYRIPARGARSERRYWSMADLAPDRYRGRAAVQRLSETLTRAASRVGGAFPKPVCDLTGGYDSRAVVAAFLRAGVSFETVVSGPDGSPDVTVSRNLARLAGLHHTQNASIEPADLDECRRAFTVTDGEYDLVEYGRILRNHARLSERYDISVNGSFGEVARGYWWEILFPHAGAKVPLDARRLASTRYAAGSASALAFPPDVTLDLVSHFAGVIERTNAGLESFPNTFQMDHAYLMLRMQRWQGRIASSTDQLWPCLSPFLFRSVLETSLQVPARERRGSALVRRLLLELWPAFAQAPMEHGYPPLPLSLTTLHRFWPVPLYYGRRVLAKVLGSRGHAGPAIEPPRKRLLQSEEVRELLRPSGMRLAALVGEEELTRFLGSPGMGTGYEQAWTRVFSLEHALRAVETGR